MTNIGQFLVIFAVIFIAETVEDIFVKNPADVRANYLYSEQYSNRMQIARYKAKINAFAGVIEKCAEEDYRNKDNTKYAKTH